MLIHKNDIEKRLKENPEPIEVTKMREHILSSFANLEFIEEGHIYNLHNADGTVIEKIPSASTIIARYEPGSDWDEIALRYALKYDSTKEQIQRMWHENNIKATNNGSSVHLYGENLQRFITNLKEEEICDVIKPQYEDGYLIPYGPKQDAIQKYWQDLLNIPDIYPLLPECKMYMPLGNKFGIREIFCGTADILLAYKYKGKWSIICHDYKTNKDLTKTFNRNNNITMLQPFDNMIDEALSHYTIQLSLYSMMLENLGYDVIDRRLIWVKDNGEYEKIKLPYIKKQIIQAFDIWNP